MPKKAVSKNTKKSGPEKKNTGQFPNALQRDIIEVRHIKSLSAPTKLSVLTKIQGVKIRPGDIVRLCSLDGKARIGVITGENTAIITHYFDPHEHGHEQYKKTMAHKIEIEGKKQFYTVEKIKIR